MIRPQSVGDVAEQVVCGLIFTASARCACQNFTGTQVECKNQMWVCVWWLACGWLNEFLVLITNRLCDKRC